MTQRWIVFVAAAVAALSGPSARADAHLSIEAGWGGIVRPDHWNPVFFTASDSKERPASIDVVMPHESALAIGVQMPPVPLSAQPQVFGMYLPLSSNLRDAAATLRVPGGGKLAEESFDPDASNATGLQFGGPSVSIHTLIVVSGALPLMQALDNSNLSIGTGQGQNVRVAFVPPNRLPEVAMGYDAVSLLVLNAPDLATTIPLKRQLAIIDWVRSGGRLLIVPGGTAQPTDAPLNAILPCTIGLRETLVTTSRAFGLPDGIKLNNHVLTPLNGALAMPISIGAATGANAVYHNAGLGRVAVLSLEDSALRQIQSVEEFWRPILSDAAQVAGGNSNSACRG